MKRFCLALLGVFVLLGASLAMADGDPGITLGGASHDGFLVTGLSWSFTTPEGSGFPCMVGMTADPNCVFTNDSGVNWSALTFTISGNDMKGPFHCGIAFKGFSNCSINSTGTLAMFSGGEGISNTEGPPGGDDFQVLLNGWSPGTTFTVTATPSPEPSSLLLLGSGLLGVGGMLRRRFAKS